MKLQKRQQAADRAAANTAYLAKAETVADFRLRIAAILHQPNEPIGGAKRSHSCVVRKPTDRGYRPTPTKPH